MKKPALVLLRAGTDTQRFALSLTAAAALAALSATAVAQEAAKNEIFNITYGSSRSLNQMAEILIENFPGTKLEHHPRDRLMPERGTLDVSKARKLLGYDPQFPLERGYVNYIKWYMDIAARQPELFDLPSRGPNRASA